MENKRTAPAIINNKKANDRDITFDGVRHEIDNIQTMALTKTRKNMTNVPIPIPITLLEGFSIKLDVVGVDVVLIPALDLI